MKKIILLTLLLSFISNAVPLAGDYFINQNGSEDYSSITAAVADLNSEGISAPVTFKIRSGTYDEQVTITEIIRTGLDSDLVKFRPASLVDTVIWKNSTQTQASNWVVKIEDAQFLKFKEITFEATNDDAQNLLYYIGDTDSITIVDCIFDGLVPAANFDLYYDLILTETNNNSYANSTGFIFDGNTFNKGFTGIRALFFLNDFSVTNNVFYGQANAGINLKSSTGNNVIENNIFQDSFFTFTSLPYKSIYVNGTATVNNNKMQISEKGAIGIEAEAFSSSQPLLIYNNFISIANSNGNVTAAKLGNNVKFLHNSIRTEQATDIGIDIYATLENSVSINNNIIMNIGGGVVLNATNDDNADSVEELFDNNYYTSAATLITWGEVSPGVNRDFSSLASFQSYIKTTHPKVGISEFIFFAGSLSGDFNDLHLPAMVIGNSHLVAHPQIEVTDDIDGDVRTAINVYIGADQSPTIVSPLDNADALNGSFYTVGGSTPDYPTPQEALDDLYRRGTKAEVKFKIKAGSYGTNVYLDDIQKLNSNDLISIVGSNPANKPILSLLGSATINHIITVVDTSYVTFKNLDFLMSGTGTGGLFLENTRHNTIESSSFTNGGSGIDLIDVSLIPRAILISNNTFVDQQNHGISADLVGGINVSNNTINSISANYKAISFTGQLSTSLDINDNKIDACTFSPDCYGIYVDHSSGLDGSVALISNNFIRARVGINLENNINYWNIYHNTLNTAGFGIITQATTGQAPNNLRIFNNIILTTTNKTALSINFSSAYEANNILVDYNIYNTSSSSNFFQWYGFNFINTQEFAINASKDIHSLQKTNNFVDSANGDYHLAGASIGDSDLAGLYVHINSDIDGDSRSTSFPYIGADEASAPLSVARVQVGNSAFTPDNITSEDSTQVDLVIRLMAQPTDDVTVAFATDNINEAIVIEPAQFIFTPVNWSDDKTITIQGVDENISDGDISYSVIYSVLSDDAEYEAIPIQVLDFTNTDNDLNSKIALELVNHVSEPSTSATVKFKLLNDATAPNDVPIRDMQDITIDYTYNGSTATLNSDYTALSGSVVLPALSEFVELNINPIDDNLIEQTEDLAITITSISGGLASVNIDNITNELTVNIDDNDTGLITVSNSLNLSEPATNGGFELTLTGGVSETDTEINYSLAGTANHTTDYAPVSGIATIPAMASSVIIPVSVIDDIDSETSEDIIISLNTTDNPLISVSPDTPPVVSIIDNDTDADIGVIISAINPTVAIGDVIDFTITVDNSSPINIHQAVLQVLEPQGLSFYDWECYGGASSCTQGSQSGDINDVISINANSSYEYEVFALVTGQMEDNLLIEVILNPAPFLNDTDNSNNTANASSLIDVFYQNGFEQILNRQLFEKVSGFSKTTDNHYYFIKENSGIYTFIEVNKNSALIHYRTIEVNIHNSSITNSEWLNGKSN